MNQKTERVLYSFVENLIFKGAARLAMLVATLVGGPLLVMVLMRTYDTLDRLDRSQAKLEATIERVELTATNDRASSAKTLDNLNDRITILSNRITDVQHDYARQSDVKAGFDLRDQHLDTLDHRVGALERGGK